jgi:hypothetical protein
MRIGLGLGVTRLGGGFSPRLLPGVEVWLDAADPSSITSVSGGVSEWRCKAKSWKFVQASASSRPTTATTSQNGLNTISFDGGDVLQSDQAASTWTWMSDGTQWTSFLVARYTSEAVAAFFGAHGSPGTVSGASVGYDNRVGSVIVAQLEHLVGNGTEAVVAQVSSNDTIPASQHNLITVSMDCGNATAAARCITRINRSEAGTPNAATGTPNSSDPSATFTVGGRALSSARMTGQIAELIICKAALTAAQISDAETYLRAKWGTP